MIQLHAKKNCLTVVAAELLTSGSVNVNTVSIEFSADWDGLSRVAVFASSTTAAAYSTDGVNWIQTTLPANADWRSVAYGGGKFVAVAQSSNIAACSDLYRPLDDVLVALYNRIVALEP